MSPNGAKMEPNGSQNRSKIRKKPEKMHAKNDTEKMTLIKNLIGGAKTVQKSILDMGGAATI